MAEEKGVKHRQFIKHIENAERWKWNVVIGVPTLGQVHIKWALAYAGMVMPMNFSMSKLVHPIGTITPMRFHTAEAQNIIIGEALRSNIQWDWVLLLEDDVIAPPDMLLRMRKWIEFDRYPIVSGLYHLKQSDPPEPMTFRGRGDGSFKAWQNGRWPDIVSRRAKLPPGVKPGEVVFCDGIPTGCLLLSMKLLKVAWRESRDQVFSRKQADGTFKDVYTRKIFETIRDAGQDPETGAYYMRAGTSDLEFCDRVIKHNWMAKAGYKEASRMRYPFPVDVKISCGHVDLATGIEF